MKLHLSHDDLILCEAQLLACEALKLQLAVQNLPLPTSTELETRIGEILKAHPALTEIAKTRVQASCDAYTESLKAIGIKHIGYGQYLIDDGLLDRGLK